MDNIMQKGTSLASGLQKMGEEFKVLKASFQVMNEEFVSLQALIKTFHQERAKAREKHVSGPSSMICTKSPTSLTDADADADADTDFTPPSSRRSES